MTTDLSMKCLTLELPYYYFEHAERQQLFPLLPNITY
jgi:hypothetical protein